jgi:hypothetical protein
VHLKVSRDCEERMRAKVLFKEMCRQVVIERNPEKLLNLVRELNRLAMERIAKRSLARTELFDA